MHEVVIIVAKYFLALSLLGALYCFWELELGAKKRFILEAIIGGIVAVVLAKIGSHFFNNPRPFVAGHFAPYYPHGTDNGFPSDHTLLSSFLGFLVLKYRRNLGYALLILAALIGAARVVAGVHHVVDIVGAFVFSALGVLIAIVVVRILAKKKSKSGNGGEI